MGKNWTTVFTNSTSTKESASDFNKRMKKASNMIDAIQPMKAKERIKHCKALDAQKKSDDAKLLEAYEAKKLKSKRLIRRAKNLAAAKATE